MHNTSYETQANEYISLLEVLMGCTPSKSSGEVHRRVPPAFVVESDITLST